MSKRLVRPVDSLHLQAKMTPSLPDVWKVNCNDIEFEFLRLRVVTLKTSLCVQVISSLFQSGYSESLLCNTHTSNKDREMLSLEAYYISDRATGPR